MKILLTGMTKMQANRPRRREYNTSINALFHALTEAKHKVDWRPLEFNENLNQYDLVILGLGTVSEFSCTYLYESLLATKFDRLLYLVNDWKANATIRLLQETDIFREFVFKNNIGNRLAGTLVTKFEDKLERCRNKMFASGKRHLLGPFFRGWGNRAIITQDTPFNSIHEFDPSSFYLQHWEKVKLTPDTKREKRWIYGALADYSRWHTRLEARWPIVGFNKKTFIPEEELVRNYYATSWGTLFPKYKASGSGWWRARYCHAILCKNIMHGDDSEFGGLSSDFNRPIGSIESASERGIRKFADYQADELRGHIPSWRDVVETVDDIVKEVAKA